MRSSRSFPAATRAWRGLALALPATLALSVITQVPVSAAMHGRIPKPAAVASVSGRSVKAGKPAGDATASQNMRSAASPSWPPAATVEVAVPDVDASAQAASGSSRVALTAVPGTPFAVGPATDAANGGGQGTAASAAGPSRPSSVRLQVLDPASGRPSSWAMIARISRSDAAAASSGRVTVSLDYSGFRNAYGGDWSNRLRLVEIPECALTTPEAGRCRAVDLGAGNDVAAGRLSATVTLSAPTSAGARSQSLTQSAAQPSVAEALVALASAPQSSSGGGDYAATAFAPTGTWAAGGQSGDFTWSYPMRAPDGLGGPTPTVGLSYSAQSLDGRTAATNNQPSWVGDGFDYTVGSVNRAYPSCVDDGKSGVGDLCWGTDNATLSLPGHSGELIQVSTSPDVWKIKNDDGSKVERITGAANGARNGEYWKVTTTDGWQYFFGLNQLPGFTSSMATTQSVFTVPVFGNNSGEPCYNATFGSAWCQQGYQWNLDYVLDPHGNSESMWYAQELNHYARNMTASSVSSYTRGGHIDHIDYGTRQDSGADSVYSATGAPVRVKFTTADRCLTAGSTCVQSNPSNWPDVPWDQQCDSSTSCSINSPTFFTQKMLSMVTTKILRAGETVYDNVERWSLNHVFKDPGDGHAKTLWLFGIAHSGLDGMTTTTPDVTFNGVQKDNRVDTSASKDPIVRYRISSIVNEAGGEVAVTYSAAECVLGSNMPASADSNTKRCYPVYWTPYGTSTPTFDWFHKYVVTGVTATDPTGGAPSEVYTYTFQDLPAWRYDESELIPASHKSWGQWRGYSKVRVTHGDASSARQQTDTVYFRGMNGDKTSSGTRTVQLAADPDFGSTAVNDENWRYGQVREKTIYNGTGNSAPIVSKTLIEPWEHGPTATRTRNGVTVKAYVTNSKSSITKTALDGGRGWRTTMSTNTFDFDDGSAAPTGRITKVDDANDISTSNDDRCTTYSYAANTSSNMLTAVAEIKKVGVSCGAVPNVATDVISDTRTWYDNATGFDLSIAKGDVTRIEELDHYSGSTPAYYTQKKATYDVYGRILTSHDALNLKTTVAYTPATGALPNSVTTTNPMNWTSTVESDPAYGQPTAKIDPNGARTDLVYDGLGRLTSVWLPGRDKATQTASATYTYVLGGSAAITSVASATLNTTGSGYLTSYTLYDGFLRPRQTQAPAVGGGRVITDTLYDSRGLEVQNNESYFNSASPSSTLFAPASAVPGRRLTSYDGAARATAVVFQVDGVERWRTSVSFGGDHTDTTAPAGGQATSAWTNALGQSTQLRQYHGSAPVGGYDTTVYGYDHRGKTATITDPAGSVWQFSYDQRVRNTRTIDPDRGTTDYTYDDADQQLTATDARGITLTNVYDNLGRKTAVYQGTVATGTLLVDTTFDTLKKGQQTSSTRYVNGNSYTTAVTGFDAAYRPTGTSVTIPAVEGDLAGTYTSSVGYNADGSTATTTLPAAGGLPAETLTYGYNSLGLPTTMTGLSTYVTQTSYDSLGRTGLVTTSDGGAKTLAQLWSYERGTNRLLEHGVYDNGTGNVFQDAYYTYDNAGNVTSIKDLTNQYGAGPDDSQCLGYDYAQRTTAAWTPADGDCSAAPTVAGLGGPAPYWLSWTYDAAGDRLTQVDHAAAGDTTGTYTYPTATAPRPHALSTVSTTGPAGTTTNAYQYDQAGNTISRAVADKPTQTLTWDAEGRLGSVADSNGTTSYVYDGSGGRLIEHDANGATLYLGSQEIRLPKTGSAAATRFYGGSAVRTTTGGLFWTTSDPHGTNNLSFKASDLTKTQRRTTPFGLARGTNPTWVSDRGFVGGIADATGLTQLGARAYDPSLGRFISVDPRFDSGDPQSFNGYSYAHNNPASAADPSGLSDGFNKVYLGSRSGQYSTPGYIHYWRSDYYAFCRSDGACLGAVDSDGNKYLLVEIDTTIITVKVGNDTGTAWSLTPHPRQQPTSCPTAPDQPDSPPTCDFWDIKCGWKHPARWWNANKDWVTGGATVAGAALCIVATAGVCGVAGAVGFGISAAARTYDFVHDGHADTWQGWLAYAGGLGIDAVTGFGLPALRLGRFNFGGMGGLPGVRAETEISRQVSRQAARAGLDAPMRPMRWGEQFGRPGDRMLPALKGFQAASVQTAWAVISAPSSFPWQDWAGGVDVTNPFSYKPSDWGLGS